MSTITHSTAQPPAPNPDSTTTPEIPSFLQTAGTVTKYIAAVLLSIVGVGSLGIGITMAPFSPSAGAAAIALSTTLFGIAGYLIYSEMSSPPTSLNARDIAPL